MQTVSLFQIVWRLVLAISLVATPLVPIPAAAHDEGADATQTVASAMPCHAMPVPPPADDAPCDDGCCPMPDCDPGACRIAGSLVTGFAPLLPGMPTVAYVVSFRAPAVPGVPFGEPLRPPIA